MDDPNCVHFFLRLRDRFADHGLVCLMIALRRENVLEVDTWLMSCRVIGRTVEAEMLKQLYGRARDLGCDSIRGIYRPSSKNAMVKEIYGQHGFDCVGENDGIMTWNYDLRNRPPLTNDYIKVVEAWEDTDDPA
jgi:FkbH-like protein